MCVTYFAQHQGCDHKFLTGSFSCGLACTPDRHHVFHIDDLDPFGCSICRLLDANELDPDIVPVQWQLCTQDENGNRIYPDAVEQVEEQQQSEHAVSDVEAPHQSSLSDLVEEMREMRLGRRRSAASLSDIDSVTSEWRQEPPHPPPPATPAPAFFSSPQAYDISPPAYLLKPEAYCTNTPNTFHSTPKTFAPHIRPYPVTPQRYYNTPTAYRNFTPRTAMHKHLVRGQLAHLPVQPHLRSQSPQPRFHGFSPFGGAPRGPSRPIKPLRLRRTGSRHTRNKSEKVVTVQQTVPDVAGSEEFPELPGRRGRE